MTPLYCIFNTKADAVRLLNASFEARLMARKARASSPAEAEFYALRADALMKAARALETAMREAE